ncbi:MAG: hypothetical protein K6A65_09290 [Succinivibrionaceae bacterium]|nr:hypothetical protein [Succinivibrionaceae bacterium]
MSMSVASGSNMESMAIAMSKRATEAQGAQALSLLQGAVQSVQATSSMHSPAPAPAPTTSPAGGVVGSRIDVSA